MRKWLPYGLIEHRKQWLSGRAHLWWVEASQRSQTLRIKNPVNNEIQVSYHGVNGYFWVQLVLSGYFPEKRTLRSQKTHCGLRTFFVFRTLFISLSFSILMNSISFHSYMNSWYFHNRTYMQTYRFPPTPTGHPSPFGAEAKKGGHLLGGGRLIRRIR